MTSIPNYLIVIAGPTGVGKTALSIKVAQALQTSIVSADSRQCYRQMTIGTAKPSPEELAAVPHYFIDNFDIADNVNAGRYEQIALGYLDQIFSERPLAVVCGGTGLYIKALCEGIDEMPKTDSDIEKSIQQRYEKEGVLWLQNSLASEDPDFYAQAEQQNPARLIRALAFIRTNNVSILKFRSGLVKQRPFNIIKIGLDLPRQDLYQRINHRVDIMMQEGLWQEAEKLYPLKHLKNLQTVGYTEIFDCIDGKTSQTECIELIKQHTRNYAKRQLTWFKKDQGYQRFSPFDYVGVMKFIEATMNSN